MNAIRHGYRLTVHVQECPHKAPDAARHSMSAVPSMRLYHSMVLSRLLLSDGFFYLKHEGLVCWEDVSEPYYRVLSTNAHAVDGLHDDKHEEEAIDGGAIRGCQEHSTCMWHTVSMKGSAL